MNLLLVKNLGNSVGPFLLGVYVKARQRVRGFIIMHQVLDRYLGNMLVKLDLLIRKTGILNSELRKGYLDHNGFKIHFGKEDSDQAAFIVTNNDYETETREAIENILERGDVFVDLGANIGFFTLLAARIVGPEGKVFAFEPTPSTRKFLVKNVLENDFNDRVVIENYAISDRRSKAKFSVTALSEYNSICVGEGGREGTIEVDTISLDEYFLEKGMMRVDLIKMDIEGQELPAMRGMGNINEGNQEIKIIFEYHKEHIKYNKLTSIEIFQLLKDYGFKNFTVLFREPYKIKIPDDLKILESAATRANLNILAEK